jgi:hypothetical protein
MNKQDKVKLIAEKCMGWDAPTADGFNSGVFWRKDGLIQRRTEPHPNYKHFAPYDNDADCMAVWERFAKGYELRLFRREHDWSAGVSLPHGMFISEHTDRRTAMMDCVVEAIKE